MAKVTDRLFAAMTGAVRYRVWEQVMSRRAGGSRIHEEFSYIQTETGSFEGTFVRLNTENADWNRLGARPLFENPYNVWLLHQRAVWPWQAVNDGMELCPVRGGKPWRIEKRGQWCLISPQQGESFWFMLTTAIEHAENEAALAGHLVPWPLRPWQHSALRSIQW